MNERFDFTTAIEPQIFDRLVDGELSLAEERSLLAALDTRPDGWRRCALAFLEARAWKAQMALVAGDSGSRLACAAWNRKRDTGVPDLPRSSRASWARVFAVAACVGLAFFLGMVVSGPWLNRGKEIGNPIVRTDRESDSTHTNPARAPLGSKPSITLAVSDNYGDINRQFELPVVEANGFSPSWLAHRPAAVSPQAVEALEDQGFRVEQERLYVPVVLDDGRQAIVSFDRAAVKYDGSQF
jgi:hypothetical protein